MRESNGIVHYDNKEGFRLTVEVNQDFSDYYRSLIPKSYKVIKPRWPAHITVVRPEKEIPPDISNWGKYENEKIDFIYNPYIHCDDVYCWLNVWCKRLEDIRLELGLQSSSIYTLPPSGFYKCFHCTIGNYKTS